MKYIVTLEDTKNGNTFDITISARSQEGAVTKFRETEYASSRYIVKKWDVEKQSSLSTLSTLAKSKR